jgi:hypothetical protein
MAQDLERALQALASYSPQDAQNAASRDVLQATDLATKAPATLVPTVIKDLESAKDQVDKLNPAAKASLLDTLKRISADDSLQSADHVLAAAQMTRTALDLGAAPVVTAELDYMDQVLSGLQQKIEGALAPVTPEQAATGEAAAIPATGEAAATPEAEAEPAPAPAPPVAQPAPRRR